MIGFRMKLLNCQQCGRKIMVRTTDIERGSITCSHVGCGAINPLQPAYHYDENIVRGLPSFGHLMNIDDPETVYLLQFGPNVIGTADSCTVQVGRLVHDGRCYISRRHCTLTVVFDKWTGQLRYQLCDGATEEAGQATKYSLNGTLLNGIPLLKTECLDVGNNQEITLGGIDRFRLSHYTIPPLMLETYKVTMDFNPDRTQ